jgi:hypothetical protein
MTKNASVAAPAPNLAKSIAISGGDKEQFRRKVDF